MTKKNKPKKTAKTNFKGVYKDLTSGKFFYQTELGHDRITGKRIQKKGRRNKEGKPFKSAKEASIELIRIKNDYYSSNGFSDYNITYEKFMTSHFLPYYKSEVEESTWESRKSALTQITQRFGHQKLREISVQDCECYRLWLVNESVYSQGYTSLIYGMFRQTLEYAVILEYLDKNISKRTNAISKGKSTTNYWTKEEFQQVLSVISIDNFYEHMSFVILWTYYMTGIRVSEGLALTWDDIDFTNKKMRVHHSLDMKNQNDYKRKAYTKTKHGKRIISLDDDTIQVLYSWKTAQYEHGIKNFIFSYNDLPLYRSTIKRIIKRYANITTIQGKGLRHSHVSYLINEFNSDILVISKRLGHSSPEITLKHYAHLWGRNDEAIAELMTGNIVFTSPENSYIKFNGNQSVKL